MGDLKGKVIFISGASRGIGLAIALRAAKDGACIAIAAKTVNPHEKLEGTIFTAAQEIEKAGGKCLPIQCDIRDEKSVQEAVRQTVEKFGGIDILVNNASAIYQAQVETTESKKFDLAMNINTRGTFLCSKYCIPHLKKSKNPHILTISPPLNMVNDVSSLLITATESQLVCSHRNRLRAGQVRNDPRLLRILVLVIQVGNGR